MKIIPQSYEILTPIGPHILKEIERAGRTCYKSEDKITEESAPGFVKMLFDRGHHAMLEHGPSISVKFVCDRGVSHEIVRHRLFSFAQESTRYCNYSKEKFGNEISVIDPRPHMSPTQFAVWQRSMEEVERNYFTLVEHDAKPQMARSVLPNSLKTEIVVTGNPREWMHFFKMRAEKHAHPQMRELACPLLRDFRAKVPVLFDGVGDPDCEEKYGETNP